MVVLPAGPGRHPGVPARIRRRPVPAGSVIRMRGSVGARRDGGKIRNNEVDISGPYGGSRTASARPGAARVSSDHRPIVGQMSLRRMFLPLYT
ncbi:hypothetical protein SL003B_2524 [Polymorphum gilvum SL003B-26A1]|uniref:Uncharacterized protein n=1 Tax=Polymorphum gilvum (strain LMG 25793 / CGMCC 1.9160 / SL003B-26A1) TaxID=991905 RepID=F2J2N4_POLGS|nr:hypothetical protein SL003B_2524 [Polymorphum gilvum SL003B-26A1]